MPVTILDYVKSVAGDKPSYTAADFFGNGVAITGGCERCGAILGAYNAYPSTSGFWRCADCIGGTGFVTVSDYIDFEPDDPDTAGASCPSCDGVGNIQEIRVHTFACGDCGAVWAA